MSEELRITDANMAEIARLRAECARLEASRAEFARSADTWRERAQRYDRIVAAARVAVVARDRDSYVKLAGEIAAYDKVTE